MAYRNYRFEINTAFGKYTSIIVREENAQDAREAAHEALIYMFSRGGYRIITDAVDAKIMRRMPKNLEVIKRCWSHHNGGYFVWLVF
jgi:hypothetical protein